MRLWYKIFLCMFVLSISVFCLYGSALITKNHRDNLTREQERSINEMDLIRAAIESGAQVLGDETDSVSWYGSYYQKKKIYFALYHQEKQVYTNLDAIPEENYDRLRLVGEDTKRIQILRQGERKYMAVSHLLGNSGEYVFIYLRDISDIYEIREENLRQFACWILVVMFLVALAVYFCSRWLTRPLEQLKTSVEQMNAGDYSVSFPSGKDEIGSLGKAFRDMSQVVEEREEKLRQETEQKQQFIEAMTHEMNTPLTSIRGYAQFLAQANCTEEQKNLALGNLEAEVDRILDMYQKLRELHLMQADGIQLEIVRIQEVMAGLREELGYLLREKKIEIKESYQVQKLCSDRVLLHILLSNLLRNAINYSVAGGYILVTLEQPKEDELILTVQDWGVGIPKKYIKKITEPFYRVDKSRSRETGGSGLGLYLCKQIVKELGGRMEIYSPNQKGTIVRALFPQVGKEGESP